jgi:hypothetical protein
MYYPLSQIQTNLYANDGFAIKSTGELYSGYYWKNSSGQYFTGKTPQDTPTQELIIAISTPGGPNPTPTNTDPSTYVEYASFSNEVTDYNTIKDIIPTPVLVPTYYPTPPTQQDYQIGEFRRYFCKKTNEIQYIEISKDQFDLLVAKDPQILWQLYFPFFIPWDITGNKEQVARTNKNIVDLTMKNLRLPRFNDYIKNDYTKYYR